METFIWVIDINSTPDINIRLLTAKFGNGYEMSAPDGLNHIEESWNISIFGLRENLLPAYDFLMAHGGYRRFNWTTPLGREITVRGKDFKMTPSGADSYTLTAKLEYAPIP